MPYRSLKAAELRPVAESSLRTIPRFALVLMLTAQVAVWGTLIVASFVLLRPFQTAAEDLELRLASPALLLIHVAEFVRSQIWWVLAVLFVLWGIEIYCFVRRRPFMVTRTSWLALMIGSLLLPFMVMLVGGLLLLQAWADLISALG